MSKIADTEANATSLDGLVNDNGLITTLRNGPKPSYQYLVDGWNAEFSVLTDNLESQAAVSLASIDEDVQEVEARKAAAIIEINNYSDGVEQTAQAAVNSIDQNESTVQLAADNVDSIISELDSKYKLTMLGANGEWAAGIEFTAYNEYLVYDGTAYQPKPTTALPYTTGLTPDLNDVQPISAQLAKNVSNEKGGSVQDYMDSNLPAFESALTAVAYDYSDVPEFTRIEWQGYYAQSDGGSNWGVLRFGAHTDDGGSILSIDGNTYIEANVKGSSLSTAKFGMINGVNADDTQNLKNCIAAASGIVTIPEGSFNLDAVEQIDTGSNIEIKGIGDCTLNVIPNDQGTYFLFYIDSTEKNVKLTNLSMVGDRYAHTGVSGESGMGVCIRHGAENVELRDLNIIDMWGDGVYIGGGGLVDPAKRIRMYNVVSDNHRRQALSVTCADDLYAENCEFTNTNGTDPQCGVDLEPNTVDIGSGVLRGQVISNVTFRNCLMGGNVADAIRLDANEDQGNGELIKDIKLFNCRLVDNSGNGVNLLGGVDGFTISDKSRVSGNVDGISMYVENGSLKNIDILDCDILGQTSNNIYEDEIVDGLKIKGNRIGYHPHPTATSVSLRGGDYMEFSHNEVSGSNFGLRLSRIDSAKIHGNTFKDIPYTAFEAGDSGQELTDVQGNSFISCATALDDLGNHRGTVVHLRASAKDNIFRGNTFSGDLPRVAYYGFTNDGTTGNKVVLDAFSDSSKTRASYFLSAGGTNEVVDMNTLLTYPL